jgi:D-alanyl-D-alanine dipeptidase
VTFPPSCASGSTHRLGRVAAALTVAAVAAALALPPAVAVTGGSIGPARQRVAAAEDPVVTPGLPPDAVRLRDVAPDVVQEMRYAGRHNFVGRVVTGYEALECWLTRPAARAVARVQRRVARKGFTLKVYDCFRPQRAVDDFVRWAEDPAARAMKREFYPTLAKTVLFPEGYIAARSSHSRGSTVDVTLLPAGAGRSPRWRSGDALVRCTAPVARRFPDTSIDMGTGFDCFDPLAHLASTGITERQKRNRALLLTAMTAEGFSSYAEEWWHYTLDDEPHPDTYYDASITRGPTS